MGSGVLYCILFSLIRKSLLHFVQSDTQIVIKSILKKSLTRSSKVQVRKLS